jgi:hypothetical protein
MVTDAHAGSPQQTTTGTSKVPSGTFLFVIFGWWLWPLAIGGALGVRWLRTRPRKA